MVRLEERLKSAIRDVVDFPKKGIVFGLDFGLLFGSGP